LEGRPEAANLLGLYAALADVSLEAAMSQFAGSQFSNLKEQLAEVAIEKIGPIGEEMKRLTQDPATVDAILADGAERARALAEPIMAEVRQKVGFLGG
jgi:tryptophanyl-tRNA synthetase